MKMLNEYHHQFLKVLFENNVRFIVIGGQARYIVDGSPTRDLDVWVDISEQNKPKFESALIAWNKKYPSHTTQNMIPPLPLRPNVQLHFPEHDASYLNATGEIADILACEGVDILTSIQNEDFETCMAKSCKYVFGEMELLLLDVAS